MMDPPDPEPESEDEELRVVQRAEPREKPVENVTPPVEPEPLQQQLEAPEPTRPSSVGLLTFLGGFIVMALAVMAGYIYLMEPKPVHRFPSLDEQMSPTPGSPGTSQQATSLAAFLASHPPPKDVKLRDDLPITAEMLHVTATALGNLHLAIVNGRRLAEGDWLKVKVGSDTGALQVMKIDDGVVHFRYGSQIIDAKLASTLKQETPHPH
jgi:hypothetical protein